MSHERIQIAAENNASLCDAVCRAHGLTCEFTPSAWLTRGTPPQYYPHFVTTRAGEFVREQVSLIRKLVNSDPRQLFCLKDSFCCINPCEAGGGRSLDLLFEATWLWSDASHLKIQQTNIQWSRVESELALSAWEQAWLGNANDQPASPATRQFPGVLLDNRNIAFLAGTDVDGKIAAVAAANRSDSAIGLSNILTLPGVAEIWQDAMHAAREVFSPGLPIVSYARGQDLKLALVAGLKPIGPLRVYVLKGDFP